MRDTHDLSLRGVLVGGLIVAAGIAASLILSWILMRALHEDARGPNGFKPPAIAGPTLQTEPGPELAAYLREKQTQLEGREGNRIPIERAMQMIAE